MTRQPDEDDLLNARALALEIASMLTPDKGNTPRVLRNFAPVDSWLTGGDPDGHELYTRIRAARQHMMNLKTMAVTGRHDPATDDPEGFLLTARMYAAALDGQRTIITES